MSGRTRRSAACWSRTAAWSAAAGPSRAAARTPRARRSPAPARPPAAAPPTSRSSPAPITAARRPASTPCSAAGIARAVVGRGRPRPARRRQGHRPAARGRAWRSRSAASRRRRAGSTPASSAACAGGGRSWRSSSPPAPTAGSPPPPARASGSPARPPAPRATGCACATTRSWSAAAPRSPTIPLLTCRLPGLEGRSPVRVVLDRRLRLPPDEPARRAARASRPVWLFTHGRTRRPSAALRAAGVTLFPLAAGEPRRCCARSWRPWPSRVSPACWSRAAPTLATAFLRAGLVDRLYLFEAPLLIGGDGQPGGPVAGGAAGWPTPGAGVGSRRGCSGADRLACWSRCREEA